MEEECVGSQRWDGESNKVYENFSMGAIANGLEWWDIVNEY